MFEFDFKTEMEAENNKFIVIATTNDYEEFSKLKNYCHNVIESHRMTPIEAIDYLAAEFGGRTDLSKELKEALGLAIRALANESMLKTELK